MPQESMGRRADLELGGLRRLAAVTTVAAVAAFWFTLYRNLPVYPPRLGWPLALAALLFLGTLALLLRVHGRAWPGIAQFGFVVAAVGLGAWVIGGTLNALGLEVSDTTSVWALTALELITRPQAGWGLFSVGLMPIGLAAIGSRLPLSTRLLLPVGALILLGPPLRYSLGERTGGLIVLVGFSAGWLVIAVLLLFETRRRRAG